ncbi:GNAT family N-acetyltransferase [Brachybacterium paraconglomeratum]|uniref:GNAT family N-acetyltransferase n=1 Tax=Brachybacterium paraconglomeratum TaxID=173362 RepID=UPI0021A94435|nr:GNAT family protein [Brachybacterium paraconglomeratum]MCT1910629.1 GNAT family N-acetyltransferase [Brachybacterium paraconglomeratum]
MTHVPDGAAVPSPDEERRAVGASGDAGEHSGACGVGGPSSREVGRIRTERLRLAPVTEADEAELFALHSDPRGFLEDSTDPLTDPAQMRWVLAQWRESWERHGAGHLTVRAREGADLPVGLLGVVGLVPLARDVDRATDARRTHGPAPGAADGSGATTAAPARTMLSAYWRLHPEVTGLGVATEAMRAVLTALPAWVQRDPHAADSGTAPHDRTATHDRTAPDDGTAPFDIVAITDRGNTASLALAARLGFRPAPPGRPVPGGRADDVLLLLDPSATT